MSRAAAAAAALLALGACGSDARPRAMAPAGGAPVELTALEYRLLMIFAANRSRVLTRAQILESIWDYEGNFVEDNTLTVYIKRLREKLGDSISIETVRGVGYRVDQ